MPSLVARVRRTIRRFDLIARDSRVLVAVSGGSDSVALLHLLRDLATTGLFALAGVAHFNHQLRGAASDGDEAFCRALAQQFGLPFIVDTAEVDRIAREEQRSREDAARRLRYDFLRAAAKTLQADRIAVGHTRDDQAETLLLRLMRGAGPRGLAGIYPRVNEVVRPLLDVSHEELRAYLAAQGASFREDESNADVTIPRNRVRHELLPLLRERFSPKVVDVLAREAAIGREDAALLDALADERWADVTQVADRRADIDVAALAATPPSIARRVLQRALIHASGGRFIGFDIVERCLELAGPEPECYRIDGPAVRMERIGEKVVLTRRDRRNPSRPEPRYRYALAVPGEVQLPEAGCAIVATPVQPVFDVDVSLLTKGCTEMHTRAVVDAGTLSPTLTVRNRLPGDIFRPLGLEGRKKLQDFFVDRKIARTDRAGVPLVVDDRDRIVWVAGHAVADEFKITGRTQAVLTLILRAL